MFWAERVTLLVLLEHINRLFAMPVENCSAVLAASGLNQTDMMFGAGHGIHSITVRDIRYYFDPDFPEENEIPTVNPDFRGDLIKESAPLGGDFFTPGMRAMNEIYANDDGTDNYMIQGLTRAEKMTHAMHMLEVWQIAGMIYKKIQADPPTKEVCSCTIDEDGYGLIDHLLQISNFLRHFGNKTADPNLDSRELETDNRRRRRYRYRYRYRFRRGLYHPGHRTTKEEAEKWASDPLPWQKETGKEVTEKERLFNPGQNEEKPNNGTAPDFSQNGYGLPPLSEPEAWPKWLEMLERSMITESQIQHLAVYIYCKKQALTQNDN